MPNLLTAAWVLAFCWLVMVVGALVRPSGRGAGGQVPFDGGEVPRGRPWVRYASHIHLPIIAVGLFGVTTLMLFPVLIDFRTWVLEGRGGRALIVVGVYIFALSVALAYSWRKKDLEWKRGNGDA